MSASQTSPKQSKPVRRRLRYSLRTLLLLVTVICLLLGYQVHRARQQIRAVEEIEGLGGIVWYNYTDVRNAGLPLAWLPRDLCECVFW